MADSETPEYTVVEICAGAGGQSLGLHRAGFEHLLAVEIDETAAETLRQNLKRPVSVGDVANKEVWNPADYQGVTLLAGGVPCPPFSAAGKQLGSGDERDLFAWAVEQVAIVQPRVLMLENVRGLSTPRFSGYRQRILDRLYELGYVGEWKLLTSADYGVPQLRPRFVLVAMALEDQKHFYWPEPDPREHVTVGEALYSLMSEGGWPDAGRWRDMANDVGPTLVGGSKKHGGADLGPTRAKTGWRKLGVDGRGIADAAPDLRSPSLESAMPRLTIEMAARIQGWRPEDRWVFAGRKTAQYRQIGNAFPPPVAEAIGRSILAALKHETPQRDIGKGMSTHDPIYRALSAGNGLTIDELVAAQNEMSRPIVEAKLVALKRDFELMSSTDESGVERFTLGSFRGFTGQEDHARHAFVTRSRNQVS